MGVLAGFFLWVQGLVAAYGLLGTFAAAVTESFIFPVPTATIIAPATAFGQDPLLTVIIATAGSVIGAFIGYALGLKLGLPVAQRLFPKHLAGVQRWFEKYGAWAVFIAAFSPIPFKVFTWAGGIFRISLTRFFLASLAGRFLQFAIAAYVGDIFGGTVISWLSAL